MEDKLSRIEFWIIKLQYALGQFASGSTGPFHAYPALICPGYRPT